MAPLPSNTSVPISAPGSPGSIQSLIPMIVIFAIVYLLVVYYYARRYWLPRRAKKPDTAEERVVTAETLAQLDDPMYDAFLRFRDIQEKHRKERKIKEKGGDEDISDTESLSTPPLTPLITPPPPVFNPNSPPIPTLIRITPPPTEDITEVKGETKKVIEDAPRVCGLLTPKPYVPHKTRSYPIHATRFHTRSTGLNPSFTETKTPESFLSFFHDSTSSDLDDLLNVLDEFDEDGEHEEPSCDIFRPSEILCASPPGPAVRIEFGPSTSEDSILNTTRSVSAFTDSPGGMNPHPISRTLCKVGHKRTGAVAGLDEELGFLGLALRLEP